jgi:dihydrolipoamide dehydrogenase
MGSKVTVLGRNKQFLPLEEVEVSLVAQQQLEDKDVEIFTNHEVTEVSRENDRQIRVSARDQISGQNREVYTQVLLVAAGRASNSDLLRPEQAGIETDSHGWLVVDENLQTSVKNIWAFGDAIGRYFFKHVANYESRVVYANAVLDEPTIADYHAVPHAVFSYPEIAAVGMKEFEAVRAYGREDILIGFQPFAETARGEAMGLEECFMKVILSQTSQKILGAHIIGPQASILIQEVISLMYTEDRSPEPVLNGMHIHPSLSEVVERAFFNLMTHKDYQHMLSHIAPEIFG